MWLLYKPYLFSIHTRTHTHTHTHTHIYTHTHTQPAPVATDDIFAGIAAKPHLPIDSAPLKTPPKWFRRPCGAKFTVCSICGSIQGRYMHVVVSLHVQQKGGVA